ncbi:MAG TPA: GNAT family N-acetyltransferase [Paraburkholderia sp.]|jgi:L-amino acid N-acyltransferase YncA|nr:GNAT family N-acetyltransferase [Paraburkholderia sp.]
MRTDTRNPPPGTASPLAIRDATAADFPAIAAIYAHHVLNSTASFEETPPSADELLARHAAVLDHGLPWLVAELDGRVAGYSYATPYRPRAAYRHTIEDSVYVDATLRGQGVGRALLHALIGRCEAGPWRQMIAVIADPLGGSPALHRSVGFEPVGTLRAVGFKHGEWRDTLLMQRALGPGSTTLPQR